MYAALLSGMLVMSQSEAVQYNYSGSKCMQCVAMGTSVSDAENGTKSSSTD